MTRRVVQFSGGITSWATARRVADRYGTDDLALLFADTAAEDPDLYRFLFDAAANIGVPLTSIADGRDPYQVFEDVGFLGNSKIAPCSRVLKQEPCRRWLADNTDPTDTVLYVGIDWSEMERLPGIKAGWAPWLVEAPLCEPPYVDKRGWIIEGRRVGLVEPRLYALGYAHNNCGGTCVRGGQAQWAHTLRVFPDRFLRAEAFEERFRLKHGDVAILRDRTGGETKPLPLRVLRHRIESQQQNEPTTLFDTDDWGGCGCLTTDLSNP
jgi:hypothetical protein